MIVKDESPDCENGQPCLTRAAIEYVQRKMDEERIGNLARNALRKRQIADGDPDHFHCGDPEVDCDRLR